MCILACRDYGNMVGCRDSLSSLHPGAFLPINLACSNFCTLCDMKLAQVDKFFQWKGKGIYLRGRTIHEFLRCFIDRNNLRH